MKRFECVFNGDKDCGRGVVEASSLREAVAAYFATDAGLQIATLHAIVLHAAFDFPEADGRASAQGDGWHLAVREIPGRQFEFIFVGLDRTLKGTVQGVDLRQAAANFFTRDAHQGIVYHHKIPVSALDEFPGNADKHIRVSDPDGWSLTLTEIESGAN